MSASVRNGVSSFVNVGGVTLHFRRDGDWSNWRGQPAHRPPEPGKSPAVPILYLHSLGADLSTFDRVVAALPERAHLRQDLRGHGLSDAPSGPYTIESLAADAIGVLEANHVQGAVLVGVSVGGQVALRAALDRPDMVSGLVLCDTAAKIGDREAWQERINAVQARGVEALADTTLQRWFPEPFRAANPETIDGLRNMLVRTPPQGYVGTCHALAEEDLRPRLGELSIRTLVMVGSEDLSTPPAVVAALAEALPQADLKVIGGAGHLPMVDAPERFSELIVDYIDAMTNGSARA